MAALLSNRTSAKGRCPNPADVHMPAQAPLPPKRGIPTNYSTHPQGATINVLGAGITMLGLSATIGVLLAKTLTSATVNPFLATSSTNWNPVLAFDVFNVQVRGGGSRGRGAGCGPAPGAGRLEHGL